MKEIIYNAETGEVTERPYTAEEIEEVKKWNEKLKAESDALQQKQSEKFAILEKLGITEEEAKLLLG